MFAVLSGTKRLIKQLTMHFTYIKVVYIATKGPTFVISLGVFKSLTDLHSGLSAGCLSIECVLADAHSRPWHKLLEEKIECVLTD